MVTIFCINRERLCAESWLEARANIYNVYNDKCLAVFNASARLECHRGNVYTRRRAVSFVAIIVLTYEISRARTRHRLERGAKFVRRLLIDQNFN